jgi:glycine/D-amino acid oxidase-like deaminating enzyme
VFDAVVIGAGFYGVSVANYLIDKRKLGSIALIEKEATLLQRASLVNQARVHNGYHYPRSFTTAYRSRVNLPRFAAEFASCVSKRELGIYAIARRNSKVTARQFRRFCSSVGARLEQTPKTLQSLFDSSLVEETFLVDEFTFDAAELERWAWDCIRTRRIDVQFGTCAREIRRHPGGVGVVVEMAREGRPLRLEARFLFNCAYSGINQFGGDFISTTAKLKHEITEMALLQMPQSLERLGITLMDGPFFSAMPYPVRRAHSLSHVRYTPHENWIDAAGDDPYQRLSGHAADSRADWMMRDARRYVPALADAKYLGSMYEIKTVLTKNEVDDGRPILFEAHESIPGSFSILGGKIDNIYDVLERLDAQPL